MRLGQLLFGFRGRINRAKLWLATLIYFVIFLLLQIPVFLTLMQKFDGSEPEPVTGANTLTILLPVLTNLLMLLVAASNIAVVIKRLHDQDKSGWWVLFFVVAPYALFLIAGAMSGMVSYAQSTIGNPLIVISMSCLSAVCVIAIWAFIELGCLRGTVGPNCFGPDPRVPDASPVRAAI
jgi:uncharacterized membrane protein YhaH (DUF805 family)